MRIIFSLCLPRDAESVPIARHLTRRALDDFGVTSGCGDAIELAVSEACANVLDHSGAEDTYELDVVINGASCTVQVADTGLGFDASRVRPGYPSDDAERGRGLELIRLLVDRLHLDSAPDEGTVVILEKNLEFEPNSLVHRQSTSGT